MNEKNNQLKAIINEIAGEEQLYKCTIPALRKPTLDNIKEIINACFRKYKTFDDVTRRLWRAIIRMDKIDTEKFDELEIQLEKYINSFNRYYNALDIEENRQINVIDLTTPETQEFIQTAQNINNLFKAREENGAPLDRDKYYQDNEISTENNINQEKINYHITDKEIGAGTPRERYRNNVEAIKTLKKIESENRLATKDEQEILSKEEYNNAKESVLTAFYTPPIVINSIYKAIQNMGFEQGNVLEPSCGVGNFFGMIPQELEKSKLYGVELDSISGRIAKQLYQNANIQVKGYEKTNLQDSFFDVAIGNIPFNNFKLSDPRYDKNNFLIHDYFFAKTLDKVRLRWCYCIYNK